MALAGELSSANRLAGLGGVDNLVRCARRNRDRERGEELTHSRHGARASRLPRRIRRVVRMRKQRRDVVGTPRSQRHRCQNRLEVGLVGCCEQTERAPLAWLQRRAPEPQEVSAVCELRARAASRSRMSWMAASDVPSGTCVVIVHRGGR